MISTKKPVRIARKWQKIVTMMRRRISFHGFNSHSNAASLQATAGNFVAYTTDHSRFVIPLTYLNNNIFKELFKMSAEVFGLSSAVPIRLPCEAAFMEYLMLVIRKGLDKEVERALLTSIETSCSSLSVAFHQDHIGQQLLVCGY